jgi:triacylglycerol lipase
MQENRSPRASGRSRRGMVASAIALLLASIVGFTAPASAQAPPDPILFIHGFSGNASNWDTMISRFRAAGYPSDHLYAITVSSTRSNVRNASAVASAVSTLQSRTGADKVDIVAHSMGSLSTRYYLKNLGGTAYVDDWVSLGGPNHGTTWAYGCLLISVGCWEMLPGSSFLNALNAGDETPGPVDYGTFWSYCDGIIIPATSTVLSGATNTNVGCVDHLSLLTNSSVFAGVRDFVR